MADRIDSFPEPYIQGEKEKKAFLELADSEEGWVEAYSDGKEKGTRVYTRDTEGNSFKQIKVRVHIEGVTAAQVYDTLHDPDYRKTWDDNMIEGYEIEKLGPNQDVGYYSAKAPFPCSNRDFCNQRVWWVNKEKTEFIIKNNTVKHPDCPEKSGFVRAQSFLTGYLVRVDPEDENSCIATYATQTDPGGWIPAWLVNTATTKLGPKLVNSMADNARKYHTWKAEHNPDDKPWLASDGNEDVEDDGDDGKKKKSGSGKKKKKSSSKK